MSNYLDITDEDQGATINDRTFGYCGIIDQGGQFFTWMDTLDETLASIEDDELGPPVDWPEEAYGEVIDFVRRTWEKRQ